MRCASWNDLDGCTFPHNRQVVISVDATMVEQSDIRLIEGRIAAHDARLSFLRAERAVVAEDTCHAIDQLIARHERWRLIQGRLLALLRKEVERGRGRMH